MLPRQQSPKIAGVNLVVDIIYHTTENTSTMRLFLIYIALLSFVQDSAAFCGNDGLLSRKGRVLSSCRPTFLAAEPEGSSSEASVDIDKIEFASEEEKKEAVGNLVADDEWQGLGMELSEIVRVSLLEDLKKNAREFIGKDDYKMGDITKEIDTRVKDEVARIRGKEEYELGDFVVAMDQMSKDMTESLTGKPYEPGDLSIELDKRIKSSVADFCGKDEYEPGDLSKEITTRVQSRVEEFTGKPYEFGDVTREVENRRKEWVKDFLGEEAAANYQFGDITKKFIAGYTGKDDYQFGDLTKKVVGDLFRKRKRGGQDK